MAQLVTSQHLFLWCFLLLPSGISTILLDASAQTIPKKLEMNPKKPRMTLTELGNQQKSVKTLQICQLEPKNSENCQELEPNITNNQKKSQTIKKQSNKNQTKIKTSKEKSKVPKIKESKKRAIRNHSKGVLSDSESLKMRFERFGITHFESF